METFTGPINKDIENENVLTIDDLKELDKYINSLSSSPKSDKNSVKIEEEINEKKEEILEKKEETIIKLEETIIKQEETIIKLEETTVKTEEKTQIKVDININIEPTSDSLLISIDNILEKNKDILKKVDSYLEDNENSNIKNKIINEDLKKYKSILIGNILNGFNNLENTLQTFLKEKY